MGKLEDIEERLNIAERKIAFLDRRRKRAASYFAKVVQENVKHVLLTMNHKSVKDDNDTEYDPMHDLERALGNEIVDTRKLRAFLNQLESETEQYSSCDWAMRDTIQRIREFIG